MVQGQALTIGRLARLAGLRPSALRYYERHGVLPRPRRMPNGYRVYCEEALTYLRMVHRARGLGITLKEARQLVQLVQERQRPCEHVHTLVRERLRDVEAAIRDLDALRGKLTKILKETRPDNCAVTELCPSK